MHVFVILYYHAFANGYHVLQCWLHFPAMCFRQQLLYLMRII